MDTHVSSDPRAGGLEAQGGATSPPEWQVELDQYVDRHWERLVTVRRHLHAHPEPSGQEYETSLYLYQLLSDQGFDVQMGPEGRGVMVEPRGPGKARIALRADIDALRIQDRKEVPYRSRREGLMHACGHDAHTATVLGAIGALDHLAKAGKLPWPVPWRGIFQPAEETALGALEMIEAGVLEGIEAILATHMDPTRSVGRIGMRSGVLTANCDAMRLLIVGRGGHAARPHESIDPIAAAAQLISSIYLFVPRATDSQDSVVVTVGQVIGGENPNVIPEQVELRGTLRTLDADVRTRTIEHIGQLARGIAETSGTRIEVTFDSSIYSVQNDPELSELICRAAREVVGEENLEPIPRPSMGSEDFSSYLQHVRGAMFRLGCAGAGLSNTGLHTPTFDIDERAIAVGAKILARAVIFWSAPPAP